MSDSDLNLLAAYTPTHYSGEYPPYFNLTMVRMKGDVLLTVRLPAGRGNPPGDATNVRFTREMWKEFVSQITEANKVYEAADYLDSLL